MKPRLYLAGPMTGLPDLNFPLFTSEAARLRSLGYEIVNPAEINADPKADWLACMRADIKQLVDCDGVATLPGWVKSRGASIEVGIAYGLGLPVLDAASIVAQLEPVGAAA